MLLLIKALQFVPVASAVAGFIIAFGIKWTVIEGATAGGLAQLRAAKAEANKKRKLEGNA